MDDTTLPGTARPSADPSAPPITHAKAIGGNQFEVDSPEMAGVKLSVQHPVTSGKGVSRDPGLFGMGIIETPNGPAVIAQLMHADGTSLTAFIMPEEWQAFGQLVVDTAMQFAAVVMKNEEPAQ